MHQDDLLDFLRAIPFRPFRVTLNSGKTYDVYHPEFVEVRLSSWNYFYRDAPGLPADRVDRVSLFLIQHIEHLPRPQAAPGNGSPPS